MTMTVFIFSAFWPLWLHQPLSVSHKEDERSESVTQSFTALPPPTGLHTVTELRSLFY